MAELKRTSPAAVSLKKIGVELPDDKEVTRLRSEATVTCQTREKPETCDPTWQVCLFNITQDPCEQNNLASKFPSVIQVGYLMPLH